MNRSIKKYNQDLSTDDNKNVVIKSRNFHQQNSSHDSNKSKLQFIKLAKENAVKDSILKTSSIVAEAGWFCHYKLKKSYL